MKYSNDFTKKIRNIGTFPRDSILVTVNVVGYILVFLMRLDLKFWRKPLIIKLMKMSQQKIWLKWLNISQEQLFQI